MAESAAAAHFAFVCAMPMELRPLVRRLALRRTRVGDLALRSGRLGDASPHGKLWTTDVLHGDPGFLAELRARGVVSLDMETAAVAEVCEERHVPWSVVRAISDRATDGSVDGEIFALSNADGTPNARAVLRYAARHPGRLPGMLRLAKGARLATRVAADAAIAACARDCEAG
jgi:hypothetical protein